MISGALWLLLAVLGECEGAPAADPADPTLACAFARVDGWTRIRLADGRFGWVAPDDVGTRENLDAWFRITLHPGKAAWAHP
jgi:hypothetical protein